MAALTITARTTNPPDSSRKMSGVVCKTITGTGGDDSTVVAASTGNYHIIVGGWLASDAADTVGIWSGAGGTEIARMAFPTKDTIPFPTGVYTEDGAALVLNKVGTTADVTGYILYVTVPAGTPIGAILSKW